MVKVLPRSVERLSQLLSSLPSIGPKTANRLTFYLLSREKDELTEFGRALAELKENLLTCQRCYIVTEENPCPICSDKGRDGKKVAVVEEPLDVIALERARFDGLYHVLGGQISPLNNIGPDDLRIKELIVRLEQEPIEELIIATDPSLEGEATALYIQEQVEVGKKTSKIAEKLQVSRLARGLPVGGDIEYADELTIGRALEGRQIMGQNNNGNGSN